MPRAPKTYSPRASTSDSCETLLTPRIWLLLGGFRSYRVFCRECKHVNRPEIPRFCRLQPTRNLAAYLIAYKPRPGGQETRLGEGFVRYQMCGFWAVCGPTTVQCDSRIDSCETGFEGSQKVGCGGGFAAIRCDAGGVDYEAAKPGAGLRDLSWWWAPLGVVKLEANATPWS